MSRTMRLRGGLLAAIGVLLGGCAGLGGSSVNMAVFDLEAAAPVALALEQRPATVEVRAPSWLTTSAMQYRLAYALPQRRLAYAGSRWVAPPAEMMGLALDRALRAPQSGGSGCRLRLELDEFAQVFSSEQDSHVLLRARASLLPSRGETPVAGRDLLLQASAPSADAGGGAQAARAVVNLAADELAAWLAGLDPSGGQGLNGGEGCRPGS